MYELQRNGSNFLKNKKFCEAKHHKSTIHNPQSEMKKIHNPQSKIKKSAIHNPK